DDEKMSKSLGNFFTIREVLKKFDAEVVRLFILRAHYRSPLNYSDAHLEDARQALLRLYGALDAAAAGDAAAPAALAAPAGEAQVDWPAPAAARLREAMDDHSTAPIALSVLFALAAEVHRRGSARAVLELRQLAGLLGL